MKTFWNGHARMAGAFVLVAALGAPAALWAQPGQGWGGGDRRGGMMQRHKGMGTGPGLGLPLRQLDLSDQQREQVRTVMESHREEFRTIAQRTREAQRELQQAVSAPTVDEGAIRAASARLAEVQADGAVLRARAHAEVFSVLTPAQRERAEQLRQQFEQRRQQRLDQGRQRMEQRRQNPQPRGGQL